MPTKKLIALSMLVLALSVSVDAFAKDEAVNYEDQVASILKSKCGTCHGDGKQESGLSVTSYAGIIKGSGSGPVIAAGQSATSRLVEVISTDDETQRMPPEGDRLTESQVAIIKKWIDTGLRENAGSSAAQRRTLGFKPMAIPASTAAGPVPEGLPTLTKPQVKRDYPIVALASSARALVVASSSYQSIDLIDPSNGRQFGSLAFDEGEPLVLKFSQSGRILLAGGGKPVQNGSVVLFDTATGKRLASVADEPDAIMAADISPDERLVAIGCTSRLVKIYSTEDGRLLTTIDKHTDWITTVAYSPDGKYLATADRIGNIYLWDGKSGGELLAFSAHKKSVRNMAWRSDSLMVASCGEDGLIVWWDIKDGWPVIQKAGAHAGGVLDVSFGSKGQLASSGRDGIVRVWGADGSEIKAFSLDSASLLHAAQGSSRQVVGIKPLLLRVVIPSDSESVIAGDSLGRLHRWAKVVPAIEN
jgi:WD40 repeat protein